MDRDLVILCGADQTEDPKEAFEAFVRFASDGGVYFKLGRGVPRYAKRGCKAYVVFHNQIVGVLWYNGVDDSFEPGRSLGGDEDDYSMMAGPALRFVGPFQEVNPPVPYRKGFRSWEYLPKDLEGQLDVRKRR